MDGVVLEEVGGGLEGADVVEVGDLVAGLDKVAD